MSEDWSDKPPIRICSLTFLIATHVKVHQGGCCLFMISPQKRGKTDEIPIRVVFAETGYEKQGNVCVCVPVCMWSQRSTQHLNIQSVHSGAHSEWALQMPLLLSQSGSTCRHWYVCVVSLTMLPIHCHRCSLTLMGNSYICVTPDGITHTTLLYYMHGTYCAPYWQPCLMDCADGLHELNIVYEPQS